MSRSLLTFLDAPVVVGDPEGRVAYLNPAFERGFGISAEAGLREPLARLFEGGAREAVLAAVARACEEGRSVRFRLRRGSLGYSALASPIVAEDARVGVIILFTETPSDDERLLALHREIAEPLGELAQQLDELFEQTGGRRSERYRSLVEDGIRTLRRIQKWSGEVNALLAGDPPPSAATAFDPVRVVRAAASRVVGDFRQAGVDFDALVPARLPAALGDEARLERVLVRILRERLSRDPIPTSVTVSAKAIGGDEASGVVISIVDTADGDGTSMADPTEPEPDDLRELVKELGGDLRTAADPVAGRSLAIRLRVV